MYTGIVQGVGRIRSVEPHGGDVTMWIETGDVLLVISVSGNSPNLVKALEWAKTRGLQTIALVGASGVAEKLQVTRAKRLRDGGRRMPRFVAFFAITVTTPRERFPTASRRSCAC